jgi:hypothetical protein
MITKKLVKLAHFYPKVFSQPYELDMFMADMRRDERFRKMQNIADLCVMLVETKKDLAHSMVYTLLKMVPILSMTTTSVRRILSSTNNMKNKLRSKI